MWCPPTPPPLLAQCPPLAPLEVVAVHDSIHLFEPEPQRDPATGKLMWQPRAVFPCFPSPHGYTTSPPMPASPPHPAMLLARYGVIAVGARWCAYAGVSKIAAAAADSASGMPPEHRTFCTTHGG